MTATTCPIHSAPSSWFDAGCGGCVAARHERAERALMAANAEVLRLRDLLRRIEDELSYELGVCGLGSEVRAAHSGSNSELKVEP